MICRSRTQVRSLFEIILVIKGLLFLASVTLLHLLQAGDLQTEVGHIVARILNDSKHQFWIVQTHIFLPKIVHFEQLNYCDLFFDAYLAADTLEHKF